MNIYYKVGRLKQRSFLTVTIPMRWYTSINQDEINEKKKDRKLLIEIIIEIINWNSLYTEGSTLSDSS